MPKKVNEIYRKTVNYIKESHYSPNLKDSQEIINDFGEAGEFDQQMQKEIEKFNKNKHMKQVNSNRN